MKQYLRPITQEDIKFATEFWKMHGEPFNVEGANYILEKYNGYLPVKIQAVKEGSVVETGNVLVQITNTDPNCAWIVGYLETALLRAIWYPTAVATNSYMCKRVINNSLQKTADNPEAEILFKCHDFGFRGVSSWESAAIGACAHLVNFMGTDTVAGIMYARQFYNEEMAGFSIPAAEHSTVTTWPSEEDAFRNMIKQFGNGLYAVVSDSYDIYNACENLWPSLKEEIDKAGGTLVVRPDSGNPVVVVSNVLNILMRKFGYTVNSKGYKVLPNNIRIIQGDGVDETSIRDILQELEYQKISASNIAFGMGGALLQHLDRDTLRFAMKCSEIQIGDKVKDVYKDPATDQNKKSKKGRLALLQDKEGRYITVREDSLDDIMENKLEVVFENGKILREQSFKEIRELANSTL
jgi:nicotinamide phosphoribosyltransferase